jgi:adenine-specific DNA-methyltransferase
MRYHGAGVHLQEYRTTSHRTGNVHSAACCDSRLRNSDAVSDNLLLENKPKFYRLANQVRSFGTAGPERAAGLVDTILFTWLRARYPRISRRALRPDKGLFRQPKLQAFVTWLEKGELLDGAFWLTSAYSLWLNRKLREKYAMFFTQPELSMRLVDDLESNGASLTKHTFIDPACGGAAYLVPIAIRMRAKLAAQGRSSTAILDHVQKHIIGIEIDRTLARLSGYFLRMALYGDIVDAGVEPKFDIRVGDALGSLKPLYGKMDVVICNPPYRKMKKPEVALRRDDYDEIMEGQPNVYELFFALGLDLLKRGGLAGLLTPTSFLSGRYFCNLRTHILAKAEAPQLDIIKERSRVFIGVQQETAITILKKRRAPRKLNTAVSARVFVFSNSTGRFRDIGACNLPDAGYAWPVPREPGDTAAIRLGNLSEFRLKDYGYKIHVGAFVWNRDRRRKFKTEQVARRVAKAMYPLIWSSDIGQDGTFIFHRTKDAKHTPFVDMESSESGSILRRPCVALQRVTSSDQGRRLVAAAVDPALLERYGGIVGENHVVLLEQVLTRPPLCPAQLAALLRSQMIDRLFRCISGATNVSVFELSQLPLPDPSALAAKLEKCPSFDRAVLEAYIAEDERATLTAYA